MLAEPRYRLGIPPPEWTPSLHTYHEDGAWGSTTLGVFRENPRLAHGMFVERSIPRWKATASTILGSVTHLMLMLDSYKIADSCVESWAEVDVADRRAKAFKEAQDSMPLGTILMTRTEKMEALRILKGLMHPQTESELAARRIFFDHQGWSEYSVRTNWGPGIDVKIRCDRLVEIPGVGLVLADLKTTNDPTPEHFSRAAQRYGYHHQIALQEIVLESALGVVPDVAMLVAVRSEEPYETVIYQLSRSLINEGRSVCYQTLADLSDAMKKTDTPWSQPWENAVQVLEAP